MMRSPAFKELVRTDDMCMIKRLSQEVMAIYLEVKGAYQNKDGQ